MSLRSGIGLRRVLTTVVILALVLPFAAYSVPALVGADESYVVLTGSMRPAIAPGDVVFVTATPAAAIGVGDVITFDRGASVPTTHRVIEVVEEDGTLLFRTQGDANEDPDAGLVAPESVVGVVTLTIPFLGTAITAIDSQYGFLALVVVPFALLILDVAYGAIRSRRGTPVGTAGADDRPLPVVYDPVRAAAAYYEAAADARAAAASGGTVTARDMTASIVVAAGLVAYAGWNAYWQFTALDAPRPETMSVLSGALVCLAFLVYLRVTGGSTGDVTPGTTGQQPMHTTVGRTPDGFVTTEVVASPTTAAPHVARDEEVQYAD